MWTLFKSFDIDDSGFITEKNVIDAFHHFGYTISDEEIDIIFKNHCKNSNNKISFDEFQEMLLEK